MFQICKYLFACYICRYLSNLSTEAGCDTRSVSKRSLIPSFLFPILVAIPRLKSKSTLLFDLSGRENSWIHTFPKGISATWNANHCDQDLNLGHRVNFIPQNQLLNKRLHCGYVDNLGLFRLPSCWIILLFLSTCFLSSSHFVLYDLKSKPPFCMFCTAFVFKLCSSSRVFARFTFIVNIKLVFFFHLQPTWFVRELINVMPRYLLENKGANVKTNN